jgi:hypothetical protein
VRIANCKMRMGRRRRGGSSPVRLALGR